MASGFGAAELMTARTAKVRTMPGTDGYSKQEAKIREAVERALSRNIAGLKTLEDIAMDFGSTPKETIYSRATTRLYHYTPTCEEVYRVPVVLVMSLVSRYYILDLAPGQSLVEYLTNQGFDVYLIDWGIPRPEHRNLSLDHYVGEVLPQCLQKVHEDSGEPDVALVGYCLGGVLSMMHTALAPPAQVKALACFTTPIDTNGMKLYKAWAESEHFDIDALVDKLGNIPGQMMDAVLQALRPLQKTANRMGLLNHVEDDQFVEAHYRFERWSSDQIPMAGATAKQLFKDFLRDNKFLKNQMEIQGRRVDLANIRVPFLHIAAQHDHIVPVAASKGIIDLVASEDKEEMVLKGGHVSLVAGGNAVYRLWPKLAGWLADRCT